MMSICKRIFCLLLAAAAVLAGSAALAAGAAVPAADYAGVPVDLSAPETAPEGVFFSADGAAVTIASAGVYRLSGRLAGRLIVDADGEVELILAGVSLQGEECLSIQSRDPVTLTLAPGGINVLLDGALEPDESASAVIRSKAPLTIGGEGVLTVKAGGNNAILAKAGLTVAGGELHIYAANHGLKSAGPLAITGGNITVSAGGDGLQAEDGRVTSGAIEISGGALNIVSTGDGLQAQSALTVSGGELSVTTGGGGGNAMNHSGGDMFAPRGWGQSASAQSDDISAKGLKSDGDITVSGGVIRLSTADDSLHCARLCTVAGGELSICSSDDAIHSDDMLVISGGSIAVSDCFEGLEAFAIEIHGGAVRIYAVNDCINANGSEWGGGIDSVSGYDYTYFWQSGGSSDFVVYSTGGNMGDGVDSNGSAYITGGHLTVSTPGTFLENGIDSGFGNFIISGGEVLAGGASTMQETPSSTSEQCIAVVNTSVAAGSDICLYDAAGAELWRYTLPNYASCIIISHPGMTLGNTYTLACGDAVTELDFAEKNSISVGGGGFGGMGGGFPGMGGGPGGRPF